MTTLLQNSFDVIDYLTQGTICFFWGYLMGRIFGYSAFAVVMFSLVALLIVMIWRI